MAGHGRAFEDLREDLVGCEFLGLGFVGEADAVAEGVVEDFLHEGGREVIRAAQPREGAAGLEEGERGAGRGAEVEQALGAAGRALGPGL